ncbi:hypothetical protein HK102_008449, partial [Quaeritorhiza haematococci]
MTASTNHVNAPQNATPASKVDSFEVGWLFVQEYYTFLNRDPQKLHCFYNKKSFFCHGHEGEPAKTCHGQQEIHNRILELDFQDCKVLVSNVDSQASLDGGIIVQVLGEMSNKGGASHKFAQTFFLAEQPNGYYVLNDIFRFLKEDIDNDYEDAEDPTQEPVINEQQFASTTAETHQIPAASISAPVAVPEPAYETVKTAPVKARSPSPVKEEPVVEPIRQPSPQPQEPVHATATEEWSTPAPVEAQVVTAKEVPKAAWGAVSKPTKPAATTETAPGPAEPKKPVSQQHTAPTTQHPSKQAHAVSHKPSAAAPAPQTPQAPKAKTWANITASGQWNAELSPAKGQVLTTPAPQTKAQTAQQPAAQQTVAAHHQPVQSAAASKEEPSTDAAEHKATEEASEQGSKEAGFREVQSRRSDQRRQQQSERAERGDRDAEFSVYVKNVPDNATQKAIQEVFSKMGPVKRVDLVAAKNIAFVEFATAEGPQKCINKEIPFHGATLFVEERKKNRGGRGGYAGGGGYGGRGRGGAAGPDGAGRGRGGDFFERGGRGAGRGRGGDGSDHRPRGKSQGGKAQ